MIGRHLDEIAIEGDEQLPVLRLVGGARLATTRGTLEARLELGRVETVAEAKLHENATAQATRAAFVEFLDRLDPAELEARFERAARRGKARPADKAQYWEMFTTFYRNLIEMPADHLPHTFVEAFAAAYREALKKPSP